MDRKWTAPKCAYTVEGGHIRTDGSVHSKVSGTSIGGILGVSPFTTPFQIACGLLGLGGEDIGDKPAVKAGRDLESVIIDYIGKAWPDKQFIPAEDLFEAREGDHDKWPSDFENNIFSGHVDGMVLEGGDEYSVLEVKTTSNLESWLDGVPVYYKWQVALYNHFMAQKDHAWVALGMVDRETYKDTSAWLPSEDNVALYRLELDETETEDMMATVTEWYTEFILNNVTPDYDPTNAKDVALFNHLSTATADVDRIRSVIDDLVAVNAEIDALERTAKDKYEIRDILRATVKDYMKMHELDHLESVDGSMQGVLTRSVRKSVSAKKLQAAGIDPAPYMEEKVVETFSVKPVKSSEE